MLLDAQPGANWVKGSLDLVTKQASAIAEYIHDQEKHNSACNFCSGTSSTLCSR